MDFVKYILLICYGYIIPPGQPYHKRKSAEKEETMTNTELLKDIIDKSGVTITHIAEEMRCSRNRVYAIVNGTGGECTASEIAGFARILHMTREVRDLIFYPMT